MIGEFPCLPERSGVEAVTTAADAITKIREERDQLRAENHELRMRLAEVEADRDGYRESAKDLSATLQHAFAHIEAVRTERDEALADLTDLKCELTELYSQLGKHLQDQS